MNINTWVREEVATPITDVIPKRGLSQYPNFDAFIVPVHNVLLDTKDKKGRTLKHLCYTFTVTTIHNGRDYWATHKTNTWEDSKFDDIIIHHLIRKITENINKQTPTTP